MSSAQERRRREGSIPIRGTFLPRGKFSLLDGDGLTQYLSQPKHASFQLERHPRTGEQRAPERRQLLPICPAGWPEEGRLHLSRICLLYLALGHITPAGTSTSPSLSQRSMRLQPYMLIWWLPIFAEDSPLAAPFYPPRFDSFALLGFGDFQLQS